MRNTAKSLGVILVLFLLFAWQPKNKGPEQPIKSGLPISGQATIRTLSDFEAVRPCQAISRTRESRSVSTVGLPETTRSKPTAPEIFPGALLVKFQPHIPENSIQAFLTEHGLILDREIAGIGVKVLRVQIGSEEKLAKALSNCPEIEFAETDTVADVCMVPNDPYYSYQWHLPKISAAAGWDITTGSTSVAIADIDTGFDPSNGDIGSKLMPGFNVTTGTTDTTNPAYWSHGTYVTSVAAGLGNNAYGTAGLAWKCPIMPVVAMNSAGTMTMDYCASGIIWAADHGARIINMSFIFYSTSGSTMTNAINYAWSKGCVLVAAAGNDNTTLYQGIYTPYPASLSNVLTVAATDSSDNRTGFSNYGYYIKVAAPGYGVYTSGPGGKLGNTWGTSMSSPQVAGLAALVLSVNPSLTNSQVISLIESNADDLGAAGWDQYYGYGRINVSKTLVAAQSFTANRAPVVDSAPWAEPNPVAIYNPTTVNVLASDPDNGPAALTYTWSKVSGPGTVGFSPNGSTGAASSTASFSAAGTYVVRVTVSDGADTVNGDTDVVVTDPNVINAPSNLTGSASGTSVTLRWTDNASNETGFQIDRAVKVKNKVTWSSNVATVGANATSFSQAVSNGTYIYRVRAFNSSTGKVSANSNEVQVKVGSTGGGGKGR